MEKRESQMDSFIKALEERAKELNCLYKIEELLSDHSLTNREVFCGIVEAIPPGWQYPDYCHARIYFDGEYYNKDGFYETPWALTSDIKIQDAVVGRLEVFYTEEMIDADEGPFLKEERKLINTIADRIAHFALHQNLKTVFNEWQKQKSEIASQPRSEWSAVLDMLKKTDQHLYSIISRKMVNNLFFRGVEESKELFRKLGALPEDDDSLSSEVNRPSKKKMLKNSFALGSDIFRIASKHMEDEEILSLIQKWIFEDKSNFLLRALANPSAPLTDVADAIRKYHHLNPDAKEEISPIGKGIRVSLIRRFLTDHLEFIYIAKNFCDVGDFYELLQKLIFPSESHGKLGGKSAGLFLAKNILKHSVAYRERLSTIKTPKTWYIASDGLTNFVYHNSLEDVNEQKYKDLDQVRQEYPHLIQAFKNSSFNSSIINGLSRALDDFGDDPIIVRSSSLLEDRIGSAFAGKYKSLFLANQGDKQAKLEALMDAIAEVYASTFSPDPIGYRTERGFLDFNEEMGIMIQQVVGKRVGKYFFPAFAGVAFSNNEFRWSSRIKREDGLVRMVPGLGTRAVDRVGDDYPKLVAPGSPDLQVNLTVNEIIGYSPKYMDVMNLETNTFETVPIAKIVREAGNSYPLINQLFSIHEGDHLRKPIGLGIDPKKHEVVATFDNLVTNTNFIDQIHKALLELKDKLNFPVDIEFACDGENIYLLQCRPQAYNLDNVSAIIPKDISPDKMIFSAHKHVSNGKVPDLTHIVYVDPDSYAARENIEELKAVGEAVGKLNKKLPKKSFALIGPGRWGSRDDIRLGVKVSYSDVNNTALLVEIAKKKGRYVPDLSFGTHFFQDLVEASIRYLPLYPDDEKAIFREDFFMKNDNILTDLFPEYAFISDTLKVIDVPASTGGLILRALMNADEEEAVAILTDPSTKAFYNGSAPAGKAKSSIEEPWRWRMQIIRRMAERIDADRFGVKNMYVFSSSIDANARPDSDIDLVVHVDEKANRKDELRAWLEGWSLSLMEINIQKTGYKKENFVDVKFITDFDIEHNTEIVRKMNEAHDFAKPLFLNKKKVL